MKKSSVWRSIAGRPAWLRGSEARWISVAAAHDSGLNVDAWHDDRGSGEGRGHPPLAKANRIRRAEKRVSLGREAELRPRHMGRHNRRRATYTIALPAVVVAGRSVSNFHATPAGMSLAATSMDTPGAG